MYGAPAASFISKTSIGIWGTIPGGARRRYPEPRAAPRHFGGTTAAVAALLTISPAPSPGPAATWLETPRPCSPHDALAAGRPSFRVERERHSGSGPDKLTMR